MKPEVPALISKLIMERIFPSKVTADELAWKIALELEKRGLLK